MIITNIFDITADDVQLKLYPVAGSEEFTIGDDGDQLSLDNFGKLVLRQTDRVLSMLDRKTRQLLTKIDGEYLAKGAVEGDDVFHTTLSPITNLKVWKNYPSRRWESRRNYQDQYLLVETDDYVVNLTTGEITLVAPLRDGDTLIAEYNHTSAPYLYFLKDIVVGYCAIELARAYNLVNTEDQASRFRDWESDYMGHLNQIKKGLRGVPTLDDIDLVSQDRDKGFYSVLDMGM